MIRESMLRTVAAISLNERKFCGIVQQIRCGPDIMNFS